MENLTALFHHIFLVPTSQTLNRNPAKILRECSSEKCARLPGDAARLPVTSRLFFDKSPYFSKTKSENSLQLYDSRRPGGRGVPVLTSKHHQKRQTHLLGTEN